MPYEQHEDGAYAYVAAGKGCRGAFAGVVGVDYHLVEEAVGAAGTGERLLVGGKPVCDVGERAVGYGVEAYGVVIVLWSGDGNGYI